MASTASGGTGKFMAGAGTGEVGNARGSKLKFQQLNRKRRKKKGKKHENHEKRKKLKKKKEIL